MPKLPCTPAYFASTAPAAWDIQAFLEDAYAANPAKYDHRRTVSSWVSSLLHLEKDTDPDTAAGAQAKLDRYFHVCPLCTIASDRSVVAHEYCVAVLVLGDGRIASASNTGLRMIFGSSDSQALCLWNRLNLRLFRFIPERAAPACR